MADVWNLFRGRLMRKDAFEGKNVLITGGTSGLGLEMVRTFLGRGCYVTATGRSSMGFQHERLNYIRLDFCDLGEISTSVKNFVQQNGGFDIIINNAGVLSPPGFLRTKNGLEYTFQVNFLSHLLIDEIVLINKPSERNLLIVAVTSPVYRIAPTDLVAETFEPEYKPFKAYSRSKLYLALLCKHLPERFPGKNVRCIGFDPGVFSSGIYRMQNTLFRRLYRIAAPFMRNPEKLAAMLVGLLENEDIKTGIVYDFRKRERSIPKIDESARAIFWKDCYNRIESFLAMG